MRYVDDKEILNQTAILREQYIHQRRQLQELAKDSNVDPDDRISAHHIIAELSRAIYNLALEAPYGIINRRHQLQRKLMELSLSLSSSKSYPSPLPYSLLPFNNHKKEAEKEYDELDYGEEEEEEEEQQEPSAEK